MDTQTLIKEALLLRPAERLHLMELLAYSLDQPDEKIEKVWAKESIKRLNALKNGKIKTIPLNEIIQRYK
jgi:putative addiction module component (TIGR02574 family)